MWDCKVVEGCERERSVFVLALLVRMSWAVLLSLCALCVRAVVSWTSEGHFLLRVRCPRAEVACCVLRAGV